MSHSRQTEHYALPLYDGTDIINPLTDFNNANEAIDEAVYNANQRAASSETIAQAAAETVTQYDNRIVAVEALADEANKTADNVEAMMAEEFDPLKEGGYSIGDIVIYNGKLYSFINPHTGAWDAGDVKVQTIGDAMELTIEQAKADIAAEVAEAMAEISHQTEKVSATQEMIAPAFDEDKEGGYDANEFVTYADKLYKFNEHHDGAWTGTDVEKVDVVDIIETNSASLDTLSGRIGSVEESVGEIDERVATLETAVGKIVVAEKSGVPTASGNVGISLKANQGIMLGASVVSYHSIPVYVEFRINPQPDYTYMFHLTQDDGTAYTPSEVTIKYAYIVI